MPSLSVWDVCPRLAKGHTGSTAIIYSLFVWPMKLFIKVMCKQVQLFIISASHVWNQGISQTLYLIYYLNKQGSNISAIWGWSASCERKKFFLKFLFPLIHAVNPFLFRERNSCWKAITKDVRTMFQTLVVRGKKERDLKTVTKNTFFEMIGYRQNYWRIVIEINFFF